MKIHKILNNNVVICLNPQGKEQVLMGKGIGFQKKVGDSIESDLVSKVFSIQHHEIIPKLAELLADIPLEILATSERIISLIQEQLPGKLHDSIHISLTDHLNFAIERHKNGITLKNNLLWEIKKFYPQEFYISKQALKLINDRLHIELPEDEAAFITLHIINAQLNDDMSHTIQVTKIIHELSNIVKYYFKINYNEESLSYHRFFTHLKFFAQRMLHDNYVESEDDSLYQVVTAKYQQAFLCTEKINLFLIKNYQRALTKEEMMFLTIHIERVKTESLAN